MISLFLFFSLIHLSIGLKPTDLCIIRQECKGFFNKEQNYEIKCESKKCNRTLFSYACGLNVCSKSKHECNEYIQLNLFMKISLQKHLTNSLLNPASIYLQERNKFKVFIEQIKYCNNNNVYKFQLNDFCVSDSNCKIILAYGYNKMAKKIDCNCPNEKSVKCGKYCTNSSDACDYINKLNDDEKQSNSIQHCGNHNVTYSTIY